MEDGGAATAAEVNDNINLYIIIEFNEMHCKTARMRELSRIKHVNEREI
jgi:hypothetical protein